MIPAIPCGIKNPPIFRLSQPISSRSAKRTRFRPLPGGSCGLLFYLQIDIGWILAVALQQSFGLASGSSSTYIHIHEQAAFH